MKYVIGKDPITGYFAPIVFPEEITHKNIGAALRKDGYELLSAGFCYFSRESAWLVDTNRSSESLGGLGPQPSDELLIRFACLQGLAGLELQNMLTYLASSDKKGK